LELGLRVSRGFSRGEQSGLQTRIAMLSNVSLCERTKLTAFMELESAIRAPEPQLL
jgi:hypothetical protein